MSVYNQVDLLVSRSFTMFTLKLPTYLQLHRIANCEILKQDRKSQAFFSTENPQKNRDYDRVWFFIWSE